MPAHVIDNCEECGGLYRGAPTGSWSNTTIWMEPKLIQKAAARGCELCKCLLAASQLSPRLGRLADCGEVEYNGDLGLLRMSSLWCFNQGFHEWETVDVYPYGTPPHFWKGPVEAQPKVFPRSAGSDATFEFIQGCLDRCVRTHIECRTDNTTIPKRLLYISPNLETIQLVSPSVGQNPKYAALSHCWGKARPLNTTKTTLQLREKAIRWNSLPATFQDALTVANRFGICYIWIDSLCIVQDDASEWAEEASKMAQTYRNAYVTIAAASAASCEEGFLSVVRRQPSIYHSVTAQGQPSKLHMRKMLQSGIHYREIDPLDDSLRYSSVAGTVDPLDTRGWTLQERDLASRRVVYSSDEVQWACRAMSTCECLVVDVEKRYPPIGRSRSVYSGWIQTAWQLSWRQFTNDEDKLPSLSGIASDIYQITKSVYLAGIWMNDLQAQLLWIKKETKRLSFPKSYVGPSFSWVSVNGPTYWPYSKDTFNIPVPLTIVVDAACCPSTADPLARVSQGYVKLYGPVRTGYISSTNPDEGPKFHVHDQEWIDCNITFLADGPLEAITDVFSTSSWITLRRSNEECPPAFDSTSVKYLLMQRRGALFCHRDDEGVEYYDLDHEYERVKYDALVLGYSQHKPRCYERLGVVYRSIEKADLLYATFEEAKEVVTII